MSWRGAALAVLVASAACAGRTPTSSTSSPSPNAGLASLSLVAAADGKSTPLRDLAGAKGTAVFFTGSYCPVAVAYEPYLAELREMLGAHGIRLLVVNSNYMESLADVREHAEQVHLSLPIFKDVGQRLANLVSASRTSETVLFDAQWNIVYRGRVDDRVEVGGIRRPIARTHELVDAASALARSQKVNVASAPVSGCVISRPPKAGASRLSYAHDIAPILERHCAECHSPGQAAPMAFRSYEEVAAWAQTIGEAVAEKRMPPWELSGPDPRWGDWITPRRLSAAERETLLEWVRDGAPRGAEAATPTTFAEGPRADVWQLGKPDLVIRMPEPFAVPAKAPPGGVPYHRVEVFENRGEDRWVRAIEFRPSARTVVHHAVVYLSYSEHPERRTDQLWSIFAPGDAIRIFPEGTARALPRGAKLLLEVHYTPDGVERADQMEIGVQFAPTPPKYEARNLRLSSNRIEIPPGAPNHEIVATFPLKANGWIAGFAPHMHLRGKDIRYEAVLPNGEVRTLLFVPQYDFNWQHEYVPKEMIALPQNTVLRAVAHFDNSQANPKNPDPSARVYWGEQTWDEMMYGFVEFIYDEPAGSPKLREFREAEREEVFRYQGFESKQAMDRWFDVLRQKAAERNERWPSPQRGTAR